MSAEFSVHVAQESLKFSAAHFIAYPGFREPLHGHNYQVGVRVEGRLSPTGYLIDFGLIKKFTREILGRIDQRTIIPARSDCLKIDHPAPGQIRVRYDTDEFVLPSGDVALLPIVHSSAEELARFIWGELVRTLQGRGELEGAAMIEVSVAERPGQSASYRCAIGSG